MIQQPDITFIFSDGGVHPRVIQDQQGRPLTTGSLSQTLQKDLNLLLAHGLF
ncbi:hypothetical protein SAMN02745746_03770, partial [Pseudogulbenkiania subflava DSM 22618]